jgi:hypothetical protein
MCVKDGDASPYLIAALRETANSLRTISRSLFGCACQNKSDSVFDSISDHVRVKESLLLLSKRNIIFTDDEKKNVLRVFDVISSIVEQFPDEDEIKTKYTVAEITKKTLANYPVYSELVANNIERWNEVRNMIKKTQGEKNKSKFRSSCMEQIDDL